MFYQDPVEWNRERLFRRLIRKLLLHQSWGTSRWSRGTVRAFFCVLSGIQTGRFLHPFHHVACRLSYLRSNRQEQGPSAVRSEASYGVYCEIIGNCRGFIHVRGFYWRYRMSEFARNWNLWDIDFNSTGDTRNVPWGTHRMVRIPSKYFCRTIGGLIVAGAKEAWGRIWPHDLTNFQGFTHGETK